MTPTLHLCYQTFCLVFSSDHINRVVNYDIGMGEPKERVTRIWQGWYWLIILNKLSRTRVKIYFLFVRSGKVVYHPWDDRWPSLVWWVTIKAYKWKFNVKSHSKIFFCQIVSFFAIILFKSTESPFYGQQKNSSKYALWVL